MMLDYLEKQLIRHEGMRTKPYTDTVGKLTIGVGRNLTDIGLSEEEAMVLLKNDINKVSNDLTDHLGWWNNLDEPRRIVLMNMCFNLGITRLLGFRKFLLNLQEGEYEKIISVEKAEKILSQELINFTARLFEHCQQ